MTTVAALQKRLSQINIAAISSNSIDATKLSLRKINNNQMYDGKLKTGNDITPSYLDDPYFKTRAEALAYSDWKRRITPSSKRGYVTPNLFINGTYHSSRRIEVTADKIIYDYDASVADFGEEIENKYGPDIYCLGGSYLKTYLQDFLIPKFFNNVRNEARL